MLLSVMPSLTDPRCVPRTKRHREGQADIKDLVHGRTEGESEEILKLPHKM